MSSVSSGACCCCSNIELSRVAVSHSTCSQADRSSSFSFSASSSSSTLKSHQFSCRINSHLHNHHHSSKLLTPHRIALNTSSPPLSAARSSHFSSNSSRLNVATSLSEFGQKNSNNKSSDSINRCASPAALLPTQSPSPCLLSTLFQSHSFIQSNLWSFVSTLSAHTFCSAVPYYASYWSGKTVVADVHSEKHDYPSSLSRVSLNHRHCRRSLSTVNNDDQSHHRHSHHHHYPFPSSFVSTAVVGVILLVSLLSITPQYVNGLRSIKILAPDYIFYGDSMWLNCSADLDYNQIYSIKWFKDNQEMYRFITSDEVPTTFYQTTGIVIDEKRSNFGNVYIKKTDFKMDANFRCEVLAENDFNTVIEIKKIRVYYIPRDGQPIILGKKANFRPNEMVNLTCTSPMSTPAASLIVTLNGNTINANSNYYQRVYHNQYDNGLTSSSVDVQFPSHWLQTKKTNNFECSSSIVHRYNRTASFKFETRNDAENMVAFYLDGQPASSSQHESNYIQPQSTYDRLTPKIENYKKKYEIGELINLRCISAQYKPIPELYWLLDGVPVDAQYVDYRHSDYNQNGYVRVDLKYRLEHKQHYSHGLQSHHQKRNNRSSILSSLSPTHTTGTVYNFRCVQVLSDVISVATEVAELYNFVEGQALHGNSVEAVKSLIGNASSGQLDSLIMTSIGLLFVLLFLIA